MASFSVGVTSQMSVCVIVIRSYFYDTITILLVIACWHFSFSSKFLNANLNSTKSHLFLFLCQYFCCPIIELALRTCRHFCFRPVGHLREELFPEVQEILLSIVQICFHRRQNIYFSPIRVPLTCQYLGGN